jgi:hypothetical protein
VKTVLPVDGVFRFEATVRAEGNARSLRVAVPAAIVRGLVHVGWTGRWLSVMLDAAPCCLSEEPRFRVAVRPHPTSVMFALPQRARGELRAGDRVALTIAAVDGPRAPRSRRVRGEIRRANSSLTLPWLR